MKGEDHIHVRTAKITVRWQDIFGIRPVMRVYSEQIPSRQKPDPFKGEFVFNPLNIRYGKGFLYHEDHRFNFPEIMIKDRDTFYTQSLFLAHRKGAGPTEFEEHPIAFVWQRIKSK
ncbi:MAG TPA: hypothetical protein VK588_00605 [Chitinophagaceae bacterium]|nr:hypothetical protein [Chitinophagaceae bacterium]